VGIICLINLPSRVSVASQFSFRSPIALRSARLQFNPAKPYDFPHVTNKAGQHLFVPVWIRTEPRGPRR